MAFAVLILIPMLLVLILGRRSLFARLAAFVDQSRRRRLQDGAFMAMLLDSYILAPRLLDAACKI